MMRDEAAFLPPCVQFLSPFPVFTVFILHPSSFILNDRQPGFAFPHRHS